MLTKKTMVSRSALYAVSLVTLLAVPVIAHSASYKLVKTIDLPGSIGGHGDWTIYNPQTDMVWLSQSPDHAIVVIDTRSNTVVHAIPNVQNSNGIDFAGNYAFAADADSNNIVVVDQTSFNKVATLTPSGKEPDSVNFLAKENRIYVSTGDGQATEFSVTQPFAAEQSFHLKPDPVKDGPDIAVYVSSKDEIFQPVDNVVDVIDAKTNRIVDVWNIGLKDSAKATAYDSKTDHLIVGSGEKKIVVLDASNGHVVTEVSVPGAVDATVVDVSARRAYVGDKSGVVDVIDLDTNKLVDSLPSEKGMHTLAVDTKTHAVYVYRNQSNKVDVFEMTAAK